MMRKCAGLLVLATTLSAFASGPAEVRDQSVLWRSERGSQPTFPEHLRQAWLNRDPDYGYDVEHYHLDLTVDYDSETIDCTALLTILITEPDRQTIPVDLNNQLTVTAVTVDGVIKPYSQEEEQVIIDLISPVPPGSRLDVAVSYHGTPLTFGGDISLLFGEHERVPLVYSMSGPYSEPGLTIIPISHYWRACKDDLNDKSSYSCALTVPDDHLGCSNGLPTGVVDNGDGTRTCFWEHEGPIAPYLINVGLTNYQIIEDQYIGAGGSSPIIHYVWPEHLESATEHWAVTVPVMETLASLFGEYPFIGDKYGMCEVGAGPAMEHQTMTSFPYIYVGAGGEPLIVHELAHQWWGDCLTVADWDHVWLSEGFASYAVALWREHLGGAEALRNYMRSIGFRRYDCAIFSPPYIWHPVVYNKAPWVLHMLRHILGQDHLFFQMLQDYRTAHEHGNVVTDDFVTAAENVYGSDLDWFFDPWIYQVGRPEYEYQWELVSDSPGGYVIQLTLYQVQPLNVPTYQMPIDVRVTTPGGEENLVITNSQRSQTYQLQVAQEPLEVELDPDGWVLADFYQAHRLILAGPGPAPDNPPLVRLFPAEQAAVHLVEFPAYGAQQNGVNVSCGDINADGLTEILTGPGPGQVYGPHVRGFEADGTPVEGLSFLAYGTNKFGVRVTSGNLDQDIYDEIITGAGPGRVFGPHVRAFDFHGGPPVNAIPGVSFFAYGTNKWGVNVAAGDIDGDDFDEIVTGAGPGAIFGPHVRGWNVDGEEAAPIQAVSFMAYGTFRYGVEVSCGDVDGDGIDEIVTSPGPGSIFGAHVRGWNFDGSQVTPLPGLSFFAWPPSEVRYGAHIHAGMDLDRDGRADLVVGAGPDPTVETPLKVFRYDGTGTSQWLTLDAFPSGWTHGVTVAGGRFVFHR